MTYNHYCSLVTLVAEDESPETQENVDKTDKRFESEPVREYFTFWPDFCITHFHFSCVYQNVIGFLFTVLVV